MKLSKDANMTEQTTLSPVVKWVGGKRQLLPELLVRLPKRWNKYGEVCFGGGALALAVQPDSLVINDVNAELINMYEVVRDEPKKLIADLKRHKNEADYFYELRSLDRDARKYKRLSKVKRASRLLYLNKTCFNGLYRVNAQGQMNAAFGRYKHPNICPEADILALSEYLNRVDVTFSSLDFAEVCKQFKEGDFVYIDPPYDPISDTAAYTGYAAGGFSRHDQIRLKELCDEMNERGVKWMLSNSSTDFIRDLYREYNVEIVEVRRNVSCKANSRGAVDEVIVRNYER